VITRLYGPEAFGQLGLYNAIVHLLGPAAALTYPIALVLPKSEVDAKGLAYVSLTIAAVISLLTGFVLVIWHGTITDIFDLGVISQYLYLLPFVLFFTAAHQVAHQWLIRGQRFSAIARVSVLQAIAVNGAQAIAGLFRPVGGALIWIASLGRLLHATMLILAVRGRGNHRGSVEAQSKVVRPDSFVKLTRQYWDFPLLRAPEVIISSAAQSVPIMLLAAFYGPSTAGYFTICRTVMGLPTQLIGKSVGDVFYPRIASAAAEGKLISGLLIKASLALVIVGIWPYLTVMLIGPYLFAFVFGGEWLQAGEFARWLALGAFLNLVNRPAVQAMPVLSAQGLHLIFTIAGLVVRVGGLLVGYLFLNSALASVAIFGLADLAFNVARVIVVVHRARYFDKHLLTGRRA